MNNILNSSEQFNIVLLVLDGISEPGATTIEGNMDYILYEQRIKTDIQDSLLATPVLHNFATSQRDRKTSGSPQVSLLIRRTF